MKLPEKEAALLRDMLDYAGRATAAIEGKSRSDLDDDPLLAAALERFVEVIGEAASKVSSSYRAENPIIPWRQIVGMRNRLIHGYSSVDHDILWTVASRDLVGLKASLDRILR